MSIFRAAWRFAFKDKTPMQDTGRPSVGECPAGERQLSILPVRFFAGWMGGAGGRKGAFLQKSSLPSPRMTRLHSPAAFPFFPLEAPCGLR